MEHPEFAEQIPEDARIIILPKDDPELSRINRELAQTAQGLDDELDRPVIHVEFERLLPARSRLLEPRVLAT